MDRLWFGRRVFAGLGDVDELGPAMDGELVAFGNSLSLSPESIGLCILAPHSFFVRVKVPTVGRSTPEARMSTEMTGDPPNHILRDRIEFRARNANTTTPFPIIQPYPHPDPAAGRVRGSTRTRRTRPAKPQNWEDGRGSKAAERRQRSASLVDPTFPYRDRREGRAACDHRRQLTGNGT